MSDSIKNQETLRKSLSKSPAFKDDPNTLNYVLESIFYAPSDYSFDSEEENQKEFNSEDDLSVVSTTSVDLDADKIRKQLKEMNSRLSKLKRQSSLIKKRSAKKRKKSDESSGTSDSLESPPKILIDKASPRPSVDAEELQWMKETMKSLETENAATSKGLKLIKKEIDVIKQSPTRLEKSFQSREFDKSLRTPNNQLDQSFRSKSKLDESFRSKSKLDQSFQSIHSQSYQHADRDWKSDAINAQSKQRILREQLQEVKDQLKNERAKRELVEKEKDLELKSMRELSEGKLSELRSRESHYKRELKKAQDELHNISSLNKQNSNDAKNAIGEIQALKRDNEELRNENEVLSSAIQQMKVTQEEWKEKEKKYSNLEIKYEQLIKQTEQLSSFVKAVEDKNSNLEEERVNLIKKYEEELNQANLESDETIKRLNVALEKSTEQNEELTKEISNIRNLQRSQQDSLTDRKEYISSLEQQIDQLRKENQDLQFDYEKIQKQKDIDIMAAQDVFNRKLQEVLDREVQHKAKLRESKRKLEDLDYKINGLDKTTRGDIDAWKQKYTEERDQREKMEAALSKAKKRIDSELRARMDLQTKIKELNLEINKLEKQNSQDSEIMAQLNRANQEYKANITVYREMYESLTQGKNPSINQYKFIRNRQISLDERTRRMERELEDCLKNFEIAQQQVQFLKQTIVDFADQEDNHEILTKLQSKATDNLNQFKERMSGLLEDVDSQGKELKNLKNQYNDYRANVISEGTITDDLDILEPEGTSKPTMLQKPPKFKAKKKSKKKKSIPATQARILKSPSAASITHKLAQELRQLQKQRVTLLKKQKSLEF